MRSRTAVVAFVLAVAALLAAGGAWYSITTSQTAAAGKSLAQQVSETCARGGQAALELGQACAKAAEVKDAPPVSQPAAVDPADLRQAARTAVAEYCAAPSRPCRGADGQTPNFELIVDAVVGRIPVPKNGTDGANATADQIAAAVAGYCGQPSEPCRGTPGTPGTDGQNGKDGQTPTCVSEPSECRGADGQPPAGWTTSYPDGSTGTCTRADPFDPAAPRYTCTRSAPPSTNPPPLGG